MANKVIKLRAVSAGTSTPEAGAGAAQKVVLPFPNLVDGAGIAVDMAENIYVSDTDKHVIFKYRRGATGNATIFAGGYGISGNADGQGGAARFNQPGPIAVDRRGTLWVVDSGNNLIRRVDENGRVYTVASIPPEVLADQIGGITVDAGENIYLIDNTL